MNVLVVGAGMYVTGRNNTGVGTILSSLAETSKKMNIELVTVAARSSSGEGDVKTAAERINSKIGSGLNTEYIALGDNDLEGLARITSSKNYDCAIISTPDHLHFRHAEFLIKKKIHCLVVKPVTPTLDENVRLVKAQENNGVYCAVEFHKRFDEQNILIKRSIAEGKIGKLLYFVVDYSQKISIPLETFRGWVDKTNIFQYLGVHYIDLIYYLTGYLPSRVTASGTRGALSEKGVDTYDSVHATVKWTNPVTPDDYFISLLSISWVDPTCTSAMSDQKYKVIGSSGRIECEQKNRGIEIVTETGGIQHVNPYFSEYLYDADGDLHFGGYGHKSIERFITDVANIQKNECTVESLEKKKRPTFKQSCVSTAVIDAVNQSLANESEWRNINCSI